MECHDRSGQVRSSFGRSGLFVLYWSIIAILEGIRGRMWKVFRSELPGDLKIRLDVERCEVILLTVGRIKRN